MGFDIDSKMKSEILIDNCVIEIFFPKNIKNKFQVDIYSIMDVWMLAAA